MVMVAYKQFLEHNMGGFGRHWKKKSFVVFLHEILNTPYVLVTGLSVCGML